MSEAICKYCGYKIDSCRCRCPYCGETVLCECCIGAKVTTGG